MNYALFVFMSFEIGRWKKKSVNVFIVVYMYMYSTGYLVADLTTLAAGIRR